MRKRSATLSAACDQGGRKTVCGIVVFFVIYGHICCVRNKIVCVTLVTKCLCTPLSVNSLSVSSLLHNSGNKHQNNPLVSAETVGHYSPYVILYEAWTLDRIELMYRSHSLACYAYAIVSGMTI